MGGKATLPLVARVVQRAIYSTYYLKGKRTYSIRKEGQMAEECESRHDCGKISTRKGRSHDRDSAERKEVDSKGEIKGMRKNEDSGTPAGQSGRSS